MLKNYLKLAWRNLIKNRQFTFLNLIGLSTGLACTILIYLWVSDELNVNKFNENVNRIYQIMQPISGSNQAIENTPGLLASSISKEMPAVEWAASVIPSTWFSDKGLFSFNSTHIRAAAGFVSNDFFKIFPSHFIDGNQDQLFAGKNNLAISKDLALKIFGKINNIVGKTVEWNQENFSDVYTVSGVFDNFPPNSTIQFDAIFNYALFLEKNQKLLQWSNNDPSTYVLLKKGINEDSFDKKINGFIKSKDALSTEVLFAQPFSETYLYNHYENGKPSGGRIEYVKLFSVIAIFLLAIACINFMNLSTAKAVKRIKEVAIQKVMGASRRTLIIQYLSESILMTFVSLIIAIILVSILLPVFKQLTGKDLNLSFNSGFILALINIALITGFIAGSYPALYISGFRTACILKGKLKNAVVETWVRKGLVVFQFTVSIILIVSVFVVYQQMDLIQTTNLGYNRDHLIYFEKGGKLPDHKDDGTFYRNLSVFMQQLKNIPGVIDV
ncbi:MAG TPA: ABC transporter permease, partial [Puia sp.]|nr:ABC transporter permease [Puia sp.]